MSKDFLFELTKIEKDELVAKCDQLETLKHSSVILLVFTEQGVSMLSSVLHSPKAIQINMLQAFRFSEFTVQNYVSNRETITSSRLTKMCYRITNLVSKP